MFVFFLSKESKFYTLSCWIGVMFASYVVNLAVAVYRKCNRLRFTFFAKFLFERSLIAIKFKNQIRLRNEGANNELENGTIRNEAPRGRQAAHTNDFRMFTIFLERIFVTLCSALQIRLAFSICSNSNFIV